MKIEIIIITCLVICLGVVLYIATYKNNDNIECVRHDCYETFIPIMIGGSIQLIPQTHCNCIETKVKDE